MSSEITATRKGVKLTRQTLPYHIVERLSELYAEAFPNDAPAAFKAMHFDPMMEDPTLNATEMERPIHEGTAENDVQYIDLMRMSCAYCVEAIRAEKRGENNAAWIFACFAQYWLGVANGIRFVSGAGELAISVKSQKAGKSSSEARYGAAIKKARELAQDHLEGTAANAARMIKAQVVAFQDKNNPHFALSEANAEKLISSWLTDLPFKGKRGPRRPNVKS